MSAQLLGATPAEPTTPPTDPPATPAEATESPAVLGEDGNFNPDWLGHGDLAPHQAQLAKFKNPEALAKSYAHLEKTKGVPVMGEGSDENAINAFRTANGIPSVHTGYEINLPETMPDGVDMPEGAIEKYQQVAHELNLTPQQAQAMFDKHLGIIGEESASLQAQQVQSQEQAVTDLKAEWGSKFDSNLKQAQDALNAVASEAGIEPDGIASMMHNVAFIKLMQQFGSKMGESNFIKPGDYSTPQVNREESLKVINDTSHPDHEAYSNPHDPRHNEVLNKVAEGLKK